MSFHEEYGTNFLVLKSTLFQELPISHAFGTGTPLVEVSLPAEKKLDSELIHSHRFIGDIFPRVENPVQLQQIHSARVLCVFRKKNHIRLSVSGHGRELAPAEAQGDSLITAEPAVPLLIRTADCFPILLADPDRRVVAAIHSGWRGTLAEISLETIHIMESVYGCKPSKIRAAIGPGIRSCCYEVDGQLADRFIGAFPPAVATGSKKPGHSLLDLAACIRRSLVRAGICENNLDECMMCTSCRPGLFHSYRRDAEKAGRQYSAIVLARPGEPS